MFARLVRSNSVFCNLVCIVCVCIWRKNYPQNVKIYFLRNSLQIVLLTVLEFRVSVGTCSRWRGRGPWHRCPGCRSKDTSEDRCSACIVTPPAITVVKCLSKVYTKMEMFVGKSAILHFFSSKIKMCSGDSTYYLPTHVLMYTILSQENSLHLVYIM
jgi:hypothetical protein